MGADLVGYVDDCCGRDVLSRVYSSVQPEAPLVAVLADVVDLAQLITNACTQVAVLRL